MYSSLFLIPFELKPRREPYVPTTVVGKRWAAAIVSRSQTHARPISPKTPEKPKVPTTITSTRVSQNFFLVVGTWLDLLNSDKVEVPILTP